MSYRPRMVYCPQCGARPGDPCIGTVRNSHGARVKFADEQSLKVKARAKRIDELARWKRRAEAFEEALRVVAPHAADQLDRALKEDK